MLRADHRPLEPNVPEVLYWRDPIPQVKTALLKD